MKKAKRNKGKTDNDAAVKAAQQKMALEYFRRYIVHLNKKKN